jgi:hypothetical protein
MLKNIREKTLSKIQQASNQMRYRFFFNCKMPPRIRCYSEEKCEKISEKGVRTQALTNLKKIKKLLELSAAIF